MPTRGVSFRRLTFPRPTDAYYESVRLAVEQGVPLPEDDWRRDGPYLILGDDETVYAGDEVILVTEWLIGPTRLADLRRVSGRILRERDGLSVAEAAEAEADPVALAVLDLPPEDYWPLAFDRPHAYPDPSCTLELLPTSACAVVIAETSAEVPIETVVSMVSGLCAMAGAEVVSVDDVYRLSTEAGWEIRVGTGRRGATARDLIELARSCRGGVEALSGPITDARTVAGLVRSGVATALVGLRESVWFEAKRQMWDLDTMPGKIELAQDVARFANAQGGIIVIGATTKKASGDDVVSKVRGVAPDRVELRRIRAVLDERIFPIVDRLAVWNAPQPDGRSIVVIEVPSQAEPSKPFLVHGAVVSGKVEGAFFSIVRRRDEESITIDHKQVHAWLVAGRQLIERPGDPGRPAVQLARGPSGRGRLSPEHQRLADAKAREMGKIARTLGRVVDDLLEAGESLSQRMVADPVEWRRSETFDAYRASVAEWIDRCTVEGGKLLTRLVRDRAPLGGGVENITIIRRTMDDATQLLDRMSPWLAVLRDLASEADAESG